jgi:hypothetical protein
MWFPDHENGGATLQQKEMTSSEGEDVISYTIGSILLQLIQ